MDSEAFRRHGKEMIDFIADYWESLRDENGGRRPLSDAQPGYIWNSIPKEAPKKPEPWSAIFADIEPIVLAANTNWHHPNFFAYYPTACSYAGVMGDMLSTSIASIGFTWNSSPAMTELEMAMTDWLARAIGLPDAFLNADPGPGGGILQSTASDATFVAILSARAHTVARIKSATIRTNDNAAATNVSTNGSIPSNGTVSGTVNESGLQSTLSRAINGMQQRGARLARLFESAAPVTPTSITKAAGGPSSDELTVPLNDSSVFSNHDAAVFQKFVAYCSDQAHSSVEKDVMLAGVHLRKLPTRRGKDGNFAIGADALKNAIEADRKLGLKPFIVIATVGTTNTCAVDRVAELGPICQREGIWLHVDGAYAGSFLLCEEFRYLSNGIDYVDSFNFNAHKAMMINFDCSPMWFRNATDTIKYFKVDPLYLKHQHQKTVADYRHLQIALGRRFRALKIWFVLRAIGIPRIQSYLRTHVKLAGLFASLIVNNPKFELFVPEHLGLICFRLKGENSANERLNFAINADGRIHLVPANVHGVYFLRLALCSANTEESHVRHAYDVICELAETL